MSNLNNRSSEKMRMPKGSHHNIRKILQVIGVISGFGLLMYQLYMGVVAYLDQTVTIRYWGFLFIGLIFSMAVLLQIVIAWKIIMADLGLHISMLSAIRGYTLSFLPRYIPGTIWGYFSRSEWLFRKHGVPLSTSNWGSFIEVIIGVSANILVCLIWSSQWVDGRWKIVYLLEVISIPFLAWLIFRYLGKICETMSYLSTKVNFHMIGRMHLKSWIISTFLHLLNWVYYGAMLWLCVKSLYGETGVLKNSIFYYSGIFSISWLIGFIAFFFPSGIGAREITMTILISSLLKLPMGTSSIISISARLLTGFAEVFFVLLCFRGEKNALSKFISG